VSLCVSMDGTFCVSCMLGALSCFVGWWLCDTGFRRTSCTDSGRPRSRQIQVGRAADLIDESVQLVLQNIVSLASRIASAVGLHSLIDLSAQTDIRVMSCDHVMWSKRNALCVWGQAGWGVCVFVAGPVSGQMKEGIEGYAT